MSTDFGLFENIIPYITDTIVEASNDDIMRALQVCIRQMCRDTEYFTEDYILDVKNGVVEYRIESEYDAKNIRVLAIVLNGSAITNANFTLEENGNLIVLKNKPTKDIEDGLQVRTVLLSSFDCCKLDGDQIESWMEIIIAGAKYNLHSQPRKPWSDPLQASEQKKLYDGYVSFLAQNALQGGQSGATTINLGGRI